MTARICLSAVGPSLLNVNMDPREYAVFLASIQSKVLVEGFGPRVRSNRERKPRSMCPFRRGFVRPGRGAFRARVWVFRLRARVLGMVTVGRRRFEVEKGVAAIARRDDDSAERLRIRTRCFSERESHFAV